MYQSIQFSDDFEEVQGLMLEGYEENFTEDEYNMINNAIRGPNEINQITLFEYGNRTMIVVTTPGTEKLSILEVEELPDEIRNYFREILP